MSTTARALLGDMKYWRDWNNLIAALTAVLDIPEQVSYQDTESEYLKGRADGYELAMARVRREIGYELGGDRG